MTESKPIEIPLLIDLQVYRETYTSVRLQQLFCNGVTKFLLVTFSMLFLASCSVKNNPESQVFT